MTRATFCVIDDAIDEHEVCLNVIADDDGVHIEIPDANNAVGVDLDMDDVDGLIAFLLGVQSRWS